MDAASASPIVSSLALAVRADAYARAWPQYPASHVHVSGRWLSAMWLLGNNYRGSGYYGAFPPALLPRIWSLYPDIAGPILHLCSGSLTKRATARPGLHVVRVDLQPRLVVGRTKAGHQRIVRPSVAGDAAALPFRDGTFACVIADPPYGAAQAVHYGTPMPSRRAMLAEAWRVTAPGGQLAWLDVQLPMYRKAQWHPWGTIGIIRSTNHVVRLLSLFERVG